MFHGSVPPELRSIIDEYTRGWDCEHLYVGCSGNFTVERVLDGRFQLHSNDVTLYSCAIGGFLAGEPLELGIRDQRLEWLEEWMDTPERALATVLLGSASPSPFAKLDSDKPYYRRVIDAYREQWPVLHAKTVEKIDRTTLRLTSFRPGDAVDWILGLNPTSPVVCYPPFYAGDYEAQFKVLDEVFEWDAPDYPELDDERHDLLLSNLVTRDRWLYGSYIRREDIEEHLVGLVQTTNRGLPLYVYGSAGGRRISTPRQDVEPVLQPRLGPGDELGDSIGLAKLTSGQFASLRSQYMNHNIKPGAPLLALVVLVDGKLIGAFALSLGKYGEDAYLLSDFPVTGSRYSRLSRLIVAAALSAETRRLFERSSSKRARRIATTAFTNRPVSMKYRGLLKLAKREASEDPLYEFQLHYRSDFGEIPLAEVLADWKKKHANKQTEPTVA